jgi:outer membrane protein assembly factor BamB
MSISKGAFGQSGKGGFIESRLGARGWGAFAFFIAGGNPSGASPDGIGARRVTDTGSGITDVWSSASSAYAHVGPYDANTMATSFMTSSIAASTLRAINIATGATIWSSTTNQPVGSVVDVSVRGNYLLTYGSRPAVATAGNLTCFDLATGTELWTKTVKQQSPGNNYTPIGFYAGTDYAYKFEVNPHVAVNENHIITYDYETGVEVDDVFEATNTHRYIGGRRSAFIESIGGDFIINTFNLSTGQGQIKRVQPDTTIVMSTGNLGASSYDVVQFIRSGVIYTLLQGSTIRRFNLTDGSLIGSTSRAALGISGTPFWERACPAPQGDVYLTGSNDASGDDVFRVRLATPEVIWSVSRVATGSGYSVSTAESAKQ